MTCCATFSPCRCSPLKTRHNASPVGQWIIANIDGRHVMLKVGEAQDKILSLVPPLPAENVALSEAIDRVLADNVHSDIDSPPYDKALMDGFALQASSFSGTGTKLDVVETITAGDIPVQSIGAGQAARIMTGAVLPNGADTVVMFEETESTDKEVELRASEVGPEQNLLRRGTVMRQGELVLSQGRRLGPMDIGLLGEVGQDPVRVNRRPNVSVLATGNELVPASETPPSGAIRNSNGPMIVSYAKNCGASVNDLGIGRDDPNELRRLISEGLQSDVLVLSGGVSAGDLDLVPSMLAELDVEQVFHGINLKPGKPLWVGRRVGRDAGDQTTIVLGLPGNPVSSLVCFYLFAVPILRRMSGQDEVHGARFTGTLQHTWTHRGGRPTYFPGIATPAADGIHVSLCPWKGSADQRSLGDANALVVFPEERTEYQLGSAVSFEWLR